MQENPNKIKAAGIFGFIIGMTLIYGIYFYFTNREPSFDDQLMDVAKEINKHCPFPVDSNMQLDNVIAMPGKILVYNYTVTGFPTEGINLAYLKQYIHDYSINNTKTNPDMQYIRDKDVTFIHALKAPDGTFILKDTVAPKEYKN